MDYNEAIPQPRAIFSWPVEGLQFARLRSAAANGIEDAMWEMNLGSGDVSEAGPFPERPGEEDCAYYVRTGFCRFGMTCRFNHPPNRKLAVAAARTKGVYPERIGQPECQYYLKTGTCKFGATCKFHHPRDKAGIEGRVLLNVLGYPLRQNEEECTYYLRTGHCKYGSTCKFNHPPPTSTAFSFRGSAIYPTIQSPSAAGQQSYPGGLTNWHLSRASFVPSPRWQGPSNYAQLILPQGVVPVTGWNTYAGHLASASSSEGQHPALGSSHYYQSETMGATDQGSFSSYRSSTPFGLFALQRENVFPERPDQPECQFYMKTGDCKFGAVCRFHHPRERLTPAPDCALSMMGLPLRPGEPICTFYSNYGMCKFGHTCKFDHPMGNIASPMLPGTHVLPSTSEASAETSGGKSLQVSPSGSKQMLSSNESTDKEGPHTAPGGEPASAYP